MSGFGSSRGFRKFHDVHACKMRPWAYHACVRCVLASVCVGDRGGFSAVHALARNLYRVPGKPGLYHSMHELPFDVKVSQSTCQCRGRPSLFSWFRRLNSTHSLCMVLQTSCAHPPNRYLVEIEAPGRLNRESTRVGRKSAHWVYFPLRKMASRIFLVQTEGH